MSETLPMPMPLPPPGRAPGARIEGPAASQPTRTVDGKIGPGNGAAFQALLEKLEQQAQRIGEASGTIERPDELRAAVDQARESLADALSLRDAILEAWRARQLAGPVGPAPRS